MTTKVSKPSSTLTSYCALRSAGRVREGHSETEGSARTGEVNLLLLFLVEVLLGQGVETGRHDGDRKATAGGRVWTCRFSARNKSTNLRQASLCALTQAGHVTADSAPSPARIAASSGAARGDAVGNEALLVIIRLFVPPFIPALRCISARAGPL